MNCLYFNGLGNGKLNMLERRQLNLLKLQGFDIKHIPVKWQSKESFQDLLKRTTALVEKELRVNGELVLIGASAGGSLAVNVFGEVKSNKLQVITLCSRLNETKLKWWDWRNLNRMAHIGTKTESKSFYDSVRYCTNITLPSLTKQQRARIVSVRQWVDEVVPRVTMGYPSLRTYVVCTFGHNLGILYGIRNVPKIIARQVSL
jgi:hypothetical protein